MSRQLLPLFVPALLIALLVAAAPTAAADDTTWYFGASPSHTNITFTSRTDLETIVGSTNAISGSATADLGGGKLSGIDIRVPVASLRTGIDTRDEHLRSANWLDAEKFADITFKATSGKKTSGNNWEITGEFGMHGKTKSMTITATVRAIPAALAARVNLGEGNWIRVQTSFPITLADYDVKVPGGLAPKVQGTWNVEITITGGTVAPPEAAAGPTSAATTGEYNYPEVALTGDGIHYKFGLRPQGTNITVVSKTDIETVITQTNQIHGEALVNAPGKTGSVKLYVPVMALRTGIGARDGHLQSEAWLDAKKNPFIIFESTSATPAGYLKWDITGNITLHGVTKPLTVQVEMRIVGPEALQKAGFAAADEFLTGVHFRTTFKLKLSDFGVTIPDVAVGKVNNEIDLTFEALGIEQQ
ncbi:MAG: YceI family protein [Planctomycetota bacterium]